MFDRIADPKTYETWCQRSFTVDFVKDGLKTAYLIMQTMEATCCEDLSLTDSESFVHLLCSDHRRPANDQVISIISY